MELFEMLGQMVMKEKPEDLNAFLIEQLERMKAVGDRTSPLNFFSEEDIETLYGMYDVSKRGLTPLQCRETLNAIGLHTVEVPKEHPISLAAFKALIPPAV